MIDNTVNLQRVDIWMWHARIYKTRTISTEMVKLGKIRLNSSSLNKPSFHIKINDVLTFVWQDKVRVIQILNLTKQRVSAKNIFMIYKEILEKSEVK